jgi:hypothetical protein
MSRHLTVAAVTAAFGRIVANAATTAVNEASIHYARPDTAGVEPKVYIYLYQVTPNAAARNLELPVRSADGTARQRPFVALDLHYLLTFVGDEKKLQPQTMLGSVVSLVNSRPVLSPAEIRIAKMPGDDLPLIGNDADVPVVDVRFTPLGLSLEDMSKVWSVFLQTPYALSVVYRASMVLVEADIPILPALPAQRPRGQSGFLSNPAIAQVMSIEGQYQPITADGTLQITGVRLQGEQTLVRVDGIDVQPAQVGAARITLPVPAAAQMVGIHSLRIVHRPWDAAPEDATNEIESNVASFVLYPDVTDVSLDETETETILSVTVTPPIQEEQRGEVLLDQLDAEKPRVYQRRRLPPTGGSSSTLQIDLTGVEAGTYAVRVRVDGFTSLVEIDAETEAVVHTVEVLAP